jgi:hypothetical protein
MTQAPDPQKLPLSEQIADVVIKVIKPGGVTGGSLGAIWFLFVQSDYSTQIRMGNSLMNTAEIIYQLVKTMPEDQANTVLAFVESLRQEGSIKVEAEPQPKLLSDYLGILKDSPNFNEDPVEIQRQMRSEWD